MNNFSKTHKDTVSELIDPHLKTIKRKRLQTTLLKAFTYGFSASALVVALYVLFWSAGTTHILLIGESLVSKHVPDLPLTLISALMLWLMLSVILFIACFVYMVCQWLDKPSASAILHHLNREHSILEESAHLALYAPDELSVLQAMQLQRVLPSLLNLLKSPDAVCQLAQERRKVFIRQIFTIIASIAFMLAVIATQHQKYSAHSANDVTELEQRVSTNYLAKIIISVTAPSYTQQTSFEQSELNLSVLQGSVIEWLIPFDENEEANNNSNTEFKLTLSNGDVLPFKRIERGYQLVYVANAAAVYSILQMSPNDSFTTDIAMLNVEIDAKPVINIKEPILTITELAKNSLPALNTRVEIFDDYDLSSVKIVASIAKGSGESVKFRDQIFNFDSYTLVDGKNSYVKHWDLAALEMSPGDELYFSIHASDNKTPIPQTSISATRIIRWLEDEQEGITSDGVVIDFIPEYFKSQRQIIIETEALIEQQDSISTDLFKQQSRALAIDQSDLKQSYGQYLGDEFESAVMHTMEASPTVSITDKHDHDDEHSDEHEEESTHAAEHLHESEGSTEHVSDLSGYQEIIDQYGHNHGEVDIGFIKTSEGQINPKVLMKRALAEMWQAELQLQLSSPQLALPYEKEALNYLNRAKQAERIYVKRLGFEPPPVSEERRYQGKLKDILSYQRSTEASLPVDLNSRVQAFISSANNAITIQRDQQQELPNTLSSSERQIVDDMAQLLTERLNQSPEWVKQLATVKRIQMRDSYLLDNCDSCLANLIVDLSTLLSPQIAPPVLRQSKLSTQHAAGNAYAEALLQFNNTARMESKP
jgi:hypothetical protein